MIRPKTQRPTVSAFWYRPQSAHQLRTLHCDATSQPLKTDFTLTDLAEAGYNVDIATPVQTLQAARHEVEEVDRDSKQECPVPQEIPREHGRFGETPFPQEEARK